METEQITVSVTKVDGFKAVKIAVPDFGDWIWYDGEMVQNETPTNNLYVIYEKIRKTKWINAENYDFSKHKWGEEIPARVSDSVLRDWTYNKKIVYFNKDKGVFDSDTRCWVYGEIEVEEDAE